MGSGHRTVTATALLMLVSGCAGDDEGPAMSFEALGSSATTTAEWDQPFLLPDGFGQELVLDEAGFDVYPGAADYSEMMTLNETGPEAGRYLYRTHEVADNGAVTFVDLETGASGILVQDAAWRRLDGLRWTPWGTLLFGEETTGGQVYELVLDPDHPTRADRVEPRPALGVMRHEGIGIDGDGAVYVVDELDGGSIFRFVPDRAGDLSSGRLHALRLTGLDESAQGYDPATATGKVGAFEWVALDAEAVVVDADAAADAVHATEFGRPEDLELIGDVLYASLTSEDRVIGIDLGEQVVDTFVIAGRAGADGLAKPDNLARGPDGQLWIVEDDVPSDIWVARPGDDGAAAEVRRFASLVDEEAEGTGIYFRTDPLTLFVNVQHPAKALADGTWAIAPD